MINEVVRILNERGIESEVNEITKNGVLERRVLIKKESGICPCVAVDEDDERSAEEIAAHIEKITRNVPDIDVKKFTDIDTVMNNTYIAIQRKQDKDLYIRETKYEGIIAYLYVRLGEYQMAIRNEFINTVGIDVDELWMGAEKRTFDEVVVQTMSEALSELSGAPAGMFDDIPMFIVSNVARTKGAVQMLNDDAMRKLAERTEAKRLYILPSSIHECIVVPDHYVDDPEELTQMVAGVNRADVDEKEQLGDAVLVWGE